MSLPGEGHYLRAFVITGPGAAEVADVPAPVAGPGEVVVDVSLAGVCGTDAEFFTGEMSYLHSGDAAYPMRIGHEWTGVVSAVGPGVPGTWIGRRVTGDTMLGCSTCARCRSGRQHLCAARYEIGIRGGWPGALASQLPVPVRALQPVPFDDPVLGALVEPGANALRAFLACGLSPGQRLLVVGPGTIGLLVGMFAAADDVEVHVLGVGPLEFARSLGFTCWTASTVPALPFDAVVDASNGSSVPSLAVSLVEPGRRIVYIGLSGAASLVDSREIVLKDLTVTGILSGSGGLAGVIDRYAAGDVDPRPLVAATVGLDDVSTVLEGNRPAEWGEAPKILVDPAP